MAGVLHVTPPTSQKDLLGTQARATSAEIQRNRPQSLKSKGLLHFAHLETTHSRCTGVSALATQATLHVQKGFTMTCLCSNRFI